MWPVRRLLELSAAFRGSHPAAHFGKNDYAPRGIGEYPDECVAECRARAGREHQLADVDETAHSGHDPESQLKRIQARPQSA